MQEVTLPWGPHIVPHRLTVLFVDTPTTGRVTFPGYGSYDAKEGPNHLMVNERLLPGKVLTFTGPEGSVGRALVEVSWDNPMNCGSHGLR